MIWFQHRITYTKIWSNIHTLCKYDSKNETNSLRSIRSVSCGIFSCILCRYNTIAAQMRDFIFYLILGHTLKSYFYKLNLSWYVANNIVIYLIIHFFQHKQHAIKVSAELFTKDYQTNSYKGLTTTLWVYFIILVYYIYFQSWRRGEKKFHIVFYL